MFDKLLEWGTVFDWISPLIAEVQDITNGPAHTFLIPEDCGWSGRAIERLLRDQGIKTWGLMIADNMILITVRVVQARWAQYMLDRERIPIAYGVLDEEAQAQGQMEQIEEARKQYLWTQERKRKQPGGIIKSFLQSLFTVEDE